MELTCLNSHLSQQDHQNRNLILPPHLSTKLQLLEMEKNIHKKPTAVKEAQERTVSLR